MNYDVRAIEKSFQNERGETVHPEIIIASMTERHCSLFEFKSGRNVDLDQINRCKGVSQRDLVERVLLSHEEAEERDVVLACREDHWQGIRDALAREGTEVPLLALVDKGLERKSGEFSRFGLNEVFSPVLELDLDAVPMAFVPTDENSQTWEVAEVVVPQLLEYMSNRETRIETEQLCSAICPVWGSIGRPGKEKLRTQVRKVLQEASAKEFSNYLAWRGGGGGAVDIQNNPLEVTAFSKQTGAYKRMASIQEQFLRRLQEEEGQTELAL